MDHLLPQLDMTTRTLPVRLVFPNADLKLATGHVRKREPEASYGQALVVPDSAVFHSGIKSLLFTSHR